MTHPLSLEMHAGIASSLHILFLPILLQLKQFGWLKVDYFGFILSFVDTYELVGQIKHVVSEGNNDELGVLSSFLDVLSYNRHILEIKGCVNFIHEVQGSWLVVVESKN